MGFISANLCQWISDHLTRYGSLQDMEKAKRNGKSGGDGMPEKIEKGAH